LVLLVVSLVTLSTLMFSESMLLSYEESELTGQQLQARMSADSGVDAARLFLALDQASQQEAGGAWNNPAYFQAVNVAQATIPAELSHFSLMAPNLDAEGNYSSVRYGLQNESARLNLSTLLTIDQQYSLSSMDPSMLAGAMGGADGLDAADGGLPNLGGLPMELGDSSLMGGGEGGSADGVGRQLLMGLPAMTEDVADAILDFMDADDEPREYGAEAEYYSQLPNPYDPTNAPFNSVEELLKVRGVTPQLLFGQDQNRNGILENAEVLAAQKMAAVTGTVASADPTTGLPPPLGWAQYLTLYSKEKNVDQTGLPRINVNGELTQLETDLSVLGNESWSSFIIAYRLYGASGGGAGGQSPGGQSPGGQLPGGQLPGGQPPGGNGAGGNGGGGAMPAMRGNAQLNSPARRSAFGLDPRLLAATDSRFPLTQPASLSLPLDRLFLFQPALMVPVPQRGGAQGGGGQGGGGRGGGRGGAGQGGGGGGGRGGRGGGGGRGAGGAGGGGGGGGGGSPPKTVPWDSSSASKLDMDLSQSGGQITSILSLIDAEFTVDVDGQSTTFTSPFVSDPGQMIFYLPTLMDKLTAVDAPVLPGRINIMECPREILLGIPGMTEEIIQSVIEARQDGSDSENRKFETWLLAEGYLSLAQMQAIAPLLTCGGDVYRTQAVGYFEEGASFARIEATIDATGNSPRVITYRRLDHLGRGYSTSVLGQRMAFGGAATMPTN
jgi:hypothetical protein